MTSLERADKMSREEIAAMLDRNDALQQQLDWFKRQLFGEKSERQLHPDLSRQLSLGERIAEQSRAESTAVEKTAVVPHTRRKGRSPEHVLTEGLRFDESVPMTLIEIFAAKMNRETGRVWVKRKCHGVGSEPTSL